MTRATGDRGRRPSRRRAPARRAAETPPDAAARVEHGYGPEAPWVGELDDLLSRAACELVLSASEQGRAMGPLLARVSACLAAAGDARLLPLLDLVEAARAASPDQTAERFAEIQAAWNAWKAGTAAGAMPLTGSDLAAAPAAPDAASGELAMLAADRELAAMFIAEALDHLGTIEALVLQVEAQPRDTRLLNDIFRPFHTIKGNAGALGVTSIQELAHSVENLLDLGRAGRHTIGPAEIEVILRAVDLLATMVKGLPVRLAGGRVPDVTGACAALVADADALVRGAAAAVPGVPQAAAAQVRPDHPVPAAPPAGPSTPVRVDDALSAVKVDTRKLDALVDIVGELVIVQAIIQEDPALQARMDERLARNLGQLRRITSDLQRSAMSMRMMPIRPTFQKMARLVRDVSRRSGKTVELVMLGDDTELDRKVVEEINDPLMHMVRNSLDHGIETPDARRAAGKPVPARITLSACHEGGSIVIGIADDGAGLDTERIRAKAVSMGLVREDALLPPAEIHELIFRPGFSTAERVTEISGRGVGMDVVRRNIESLRGRIEIQTAPGAGTHFGIRLPLTLAILEGLLLRAGSERFVLPTFCVRESLRPARSQVHGFQGQRVIQVRESVLPLVHLSGLFGAQGPVPEPWDATVVVIEDNGRRIGVAVDELLGKQEVVIKALGEAFARVRGVAGGAILGDGRVGLILDAGGLVDLLDRPIAHAA